MRTLPLVVVLDDVPEDLRAIDTALARLGYETLAARDPASVLRRLVVEDPVTGRRQLTSNIPTLAVIDYEMHHAPDPSRRVDELLAFLYEAHPACRVIVYSSVLDSAAVRERINQAHPLALTEEKRRDGTDALVRRIHRTVGKTVGDLEILGSRLRFTHPTDAARSKYLTHHVRYQLVSYHPGSVLVPRPSDQKMVRRFRDDLERLGSCMTVEALGGKRFVLRRRDQLADHDGRLAASQRPKTDTTVAC